ncbi:hypothetical protein COU54_01530 [Candidatus Pacearchaeota archaeon CG10_big_fil_rev_8_21_14_0_10_31_24]|nr:MAG: hypothetical protein COU54_01530 [Candidatus Pacearchaeota archaeon CG10_big_fil_rev_8_21_14_0_10_31_24]
MKKNNDILIGIILGLIVLFVICIFSMSGLGYGMMHNSYFYGYGMMHNSYFYGFEIFNLIFQILIITLIIIFIVWIINYMKGGK